MNTEGVEFDLSSPSAPPPMNSCKTQSSKLNDPQASTVHNPELEAIEDKLSDFQKVKSDKILMSSAFTTALTSLLRREYLADPNIPSLLPNLAESINRNAILWMKLACVGLETGFTPEKATEALECILSAFHLPGRERLLFLVAGDRNTGLVTIHLGLQPVCGAANSVSASIEFWNGFAKSNWPGLSFEMAKDVSLGFSMDTFRKAKPGMRPAVRILTGIPASRNKEKVSATIDKLASALSGRTWRYLVIADPVANEEIEKIIQTCRGLQGRAESLKSFQLGQNENITDTHGKTRTDGGNESTSQRDPKEVAAAIIAGAALAGVASLAGIPPVPPFTAGFGAVLFGSRSVTTGTNWSETISRSLSTAHGVSFSETVANKHAEAAANILKSHVDRLLLCEAVGAWSVGMYFIGENEATADIGAHALKAILSGDDSHLEPIRICKPLWRSGQPESVLPLVALEHFDNPNFVPMSDDAVLHNPLGEQFDLLRTFLNTRELTRIANFPLSNVPGIPVRRIAVDMGLKNPDLTNDKAIKLGNQMYRGQILDKYPYAFDKDLLAKHALVCGINGSGKTNTILGILGHLLSSAAPFLVIEPAKQEYVDWAVSQNAKLIKKYKDEKKLTPEKAKEAAKADPRWITIYIPGRGKWNNEVLDELSLNPFDFVWLNKEEDPKILEHIDRLKTIINAALPMQEVLPILMEELIYSVYGTKNSPVDGKYICWLPRDASSRTPKFNENIPVPSFVEMANHIPELFKRIKYGNEVQHNLRAALTTRVDSFKRGWKRPLLNKQLPRHKVGEWDKLFKHPTVINLTSLASDDDKAFFMAIILMFIYEYRQEESEMMSNNQSGEKPQGLKHLLVIEEAHRILGRCEGAASVFSAAPKQKASELFSNMISEVRAYGQGILIADQIPGRLNEDAVKNTNLKIVHRLVASDDRQAMATSLNLWNDQERIIGDLHVGEALVRGDMDNEAYMVKIKKIEPHKS